MASFRSLRKASIMIHNVEEQYGDENEDEIGRKLEYEQQVKYDDEPEQISTPCEP